MKRQAEQNNKLKAWLQLLRLPNLFSVPGDPLAGLFLVSLPYAPSLEFAVGAAGASLGAYAGGLVDNDLVDSERDAAGRPERPIPSGRVRRRNAMLARLVLLASPFALGAVLGFPPVWFLVHVLLLSGILTYNRVKNRHRTGAAVIMGACRSLNLLSGSVLAIVPALFDPAVYLTALTWLLFIAGVTLFAGGEQRPCTDRKHYLVAATLLVLPVAAVFPIATANARLIVSVAGLGGAFAAWKILIDCKPGLPAERVQQTVGRLIRLLIPLQAVLCLAGRGGWIPAVVLVIFWFISVKTARRFYGS